MKPYKVLAVGIALYMILMVITLASAGILALNMPQKNLEALGDEIEDEELSSEVKVPEKITKSFEERILAALIDMVIAFPKAVVTLLNN